VYTDIDRQFNESFNNFVNNTKKGMSVDPKSNKVTLSSIFNWYEKMFVDFFPKKDGSPLKFIMLYLSKENSNYDWLLNNSNTATVDYFDYDWNANGRVACDSSARPCYPLWALLVTLGSVLLLIIIFAIIVVIVKRRRAKRQSYHRIYVP